MTDVFVIRNQLGHYWGKGKEWVDGTEPKAIMRVRHEDEAVNTLFELSSRDFDLRGEVLAAALTEKGEPDVPPSEHRLPKKDPGKTPETDPDRSADNDTAPDAIRDAAAAGDADAGAPPREAAENA